MPFKPDSTAILFSAVLLIALAIRLLPLTYCFSGGHIIFPEFDPYYHMRRIVGAVEHFPQVGSFDSYVNYPYGFGINWPPLFDLLAAGLALVAGLGSPSRLTIETASAALPAILGVLSVALVYFLIKDSINKYAGLLAALFVAVLPATVFRSVFAFTDHHILEVVVSLTMYLFFMRAVAHAREKKIGFSDLAKSPREYAKPLAYAVLAGVAMACMVFTWDGAPIFIGVIVAYAFLQYAYDALRKDDTTYLTAVGAVGAVAALIAVTPFILASPAGQHFEIAAGYLSWFDIIYIAGILAFFLAMGGLSGLFRSLKAPWFSAALAMVVAAVVFLLAARFALPQIFDALQAGIQFLTGQGDVNTTINEMEPLFSYSNGLSWDIPWTYLSTAGILAILGLIAYLASLKWKKLGNAQVFLLVWTVVVIVLGLLQRRFIYVLGVNVAIFAGYAVYGGLDLSGFLGSRAHEGEKSRPGRSSEGSLTPPAVAVLIVTAVLLILPLTTSISMAATADAYPYLQDWNKACQWVDDNTPKTSFTYAADNGTHPEYGIMSWWDYGNFILYRAERPAVANNFQTGIDAAARFFIAQDEAAANTYMDKRDARYVMLDYRLGSPATGNPIGVFENMPQLAGEDQSSYHLQYEMPVAYGTYPMHDGNDKYYGSMYSRLFDGDGLGGRDTLGAYQNGLQHYRLLYVTAGIDPVKVFEYVKGATITGKAAPGAKVELRLNVTTSDGDKAYYSTQLADAAGAYSFTVPYATSDKTDALATGPAYTIASGASTTSVQVPAGAIAGGETITAGDKP